MLHLHRLDDRDRRAGRDPRVRPRRKSRRCAPRSATRRRRRPRAPRRAGAAAGLPRPIRRPAPRAASSAIWRSKYPVSTSCDAKSGRAASARSSARLVATPSMRHSASARRERRSGVGESRIRRADDQLGDQRDRSASRARAPAASGRIDAHARAGRQVEPARNVRGRRLLVDAPLDRGEARRGRRIGIEPDLRQSAPRGDLDLHAHEVEPVGLLGDGVLDLQARIGLDEHEGTLGIVLRDQELERAEAAIIASPRHGERGLDRSPGASPGTGAGSGRSRRSSGTGAATCSRARRARRRAGRRRRSAPRYAARSRSARST